MLKRLTIVLILMFLVLSGCAPAAKSTQNSSAAPSFAGEADRGAVSAPGMKGGDDFGSPNGNQGAAAPEVPQDVPASQTNPEVKRLVIRNANLTIVVDDPSVAMSAVSAMTENMGGFVVTSNLYRTSSQNGREFPEANITVRVPADRLNEALAQIKKLVKDPSKDVRSETVSGQDVTKEYTDLQSRQKNLEQAEAQLREIMGSAVKTEDVLSVYNQLTQIREQIEVIKGQIKYYEESALLSSIALVIQSQAAVQPLEVGGWQPVGVARDAVQALIDTMQFVGSAAIWLILYALPVGLVIFLPLRLFWVLIQRSRKNRKQQTPTPPASPQVTP